MKKIYLDNNATTALDPRVLKAMLVELEGPPANPSSIHAFGRRAKGLLFEARKTIAHFFRHKAEDLVFTSGGTESINLMLRGFFSSRPRGHLITTAIEHSSVYQTVRALEGSGLTVTFVPVGETGAPSLEQIAEAMRPDTSAIMLSLANSETGVKPDIAALTQLAERSGIALLLDAVGFIGKEALPLLPKRCAIAFSAHKFHGPKGIGGLITTPMIKMSPLVTGGPQEFNRRAGTENLAGIVGLAEAISILHAEQQEITTALLDLRNYFEHSLLQERGAVIVNGTGPRIANTSNLSFCGIDGETLLMHLDMAGVAASHGSACSAGALEPSRVLLNMGLEKSRVRSSIRFSLSRMTTKEELSKAIAVISELIRKL